MKKLILMLMLVLPFTVQAKDKDDSKYLAGAVPEQNGIVIFQKSFSVPGKSKAEINKVMKGYLNTLIQNSVPAPTQYARLNMDTQDTLVARVCEFMVFKKKPLYLDRARFRYQTNVYLNEGKVRMEVTAISYYYNEDNDGNNGQTIRAEEWITDKEALNKTQTKLYPISGKFRRKTVDRAETIFEGAMDAFETPEPETPVVVKKQRANVVED